MFLAIIEITTFLPVYLLKVFFLQNTQKLWECASQRKFTLNCNLFNTILRNGSSKRPRLFNQNRGISITCINSIFISSYLKELVFSKCTYINNVSRFSASKEESRKMIKRIRLQCVTKGNVLIIPHHSQLLYFSFEEEIIIIIKQVEILLSTSL